MISVNFADEIKPPTMGDAIRFITCDPVSEPAITGKRPIRVVATVMIFGRTLSTAPSTIAISHFGISLKS